MVHNRLTAGDEFVSLTRRPSYTLRKIFVINCITGCVYARAIVISPGIEHATFCLKEGATNTNITFSTLMNEELAGMWNEMFAA